MIGKRRGILYLGMGGREGGIFSDGGREGGILSDGGKKKRVYLVLGGGERRGYI